MAVDAGSTSAQQPAAPALAFRGVTVIDVTDGRLVPDEMVVVVGNRIQAVGPAKTVAVPAGAQIVEAAGKYLIPGLWDAHVHVGIWPDVLYPLFIANGITGIRDAGSSVALDTVKGWRREVLAGTRVGPPRQLLSGQSMYGPAEGGECQRSTKDDWNTNSRTYQPGVAPGPVFDGPQTCVVDLADARHYVDSLADAGADLIKARAINTRYMFFAIAAEARRRGIPLSGHVNEGLGLEPGLAYTAAEASDSGERLIDHTPGMEVCRQPGDSTQDALAPSSPDPAAREQCWRTTAERYRRNDTWLVPTLLSNAYTQDRNGPVYQDRPAIVAISAYLAERGLDFWSGKALAGNWLHAGVGDWGAKPADSVGLMRVAARFGVPIVAGTDVAGDPDPGYTYNPIVSWPPGFTLHAELATFVAEGMTPLQALQAATLDPAKMWHATDSLGAVAAGKLADLVLLDANPLVDITNTTTIQAVVANGRYFDRAALDQLLTQARAARDAGWQRHGWGTSAPLSR